MAWISVLRNPEITRQRGAVTPPFLAFDDCDRRMPVFDFRPALLGHQAWEAPKRVPTAAPTQGKKEKKMSSLPR